MPRDLDVVPARDDADLQAVAALLQELRAVPSHRRSAIEPLRCAVEADRLPEPDLSELAERRTGD